VESPAATVTAAFQDCATKLDELRRRFEQVTGDPAELHLLLEQSQADRLAIHTKLVALAEAKREARHELESLTASIRLMGLIMAQRSPVVAVALSAIGAEAADDYGRLRPAESLVEVA
jgi:chromosome segregation ATPase